MAKLLVVDDDANNRDMLSRRLERRGFSVTVAEDGPGALAMIAAEAFDLVLLDVMMPGMSGLQVLQEVRKTHPPAGLPIIMATAKGEREDIVEALGLGANDYVTKPLDFPVVLARVQTQLQHKEAMDKIVALEADLRRQNEALDAANRRMKGDLQVAAKMQQSLLPAHMPAAAGLTFAWAYQPCTELGGDILNVFPLGADHMGIYLLDVSGHGVPAALLSVTLSRVLAAPAGEVSLVQRRGADGKMFPATPKVVIEELNRRFPIDTASTQYFTIIYGVLELATRRLTYIAAGHPYGLLIEHDEAARFLPGEAYAIGWVEGATFEEHSVTLNKGDRLYWYSDGVTEAMTCQREQFGRQRLAEAAKRKGSRTLQEDVAAIVSAAEKFCNQPFADDVSVLALEVG